MLIVPYSTWYCAGPLTERTARIQALPSRNSHAAPSRLISYHMEEDRRARKRGQCQKRGTDKCSQRRLLLVGVTREDSMEEAIFELDLEMRWKRDRIKAWRWQQQVAPSGVIERFTGDKSQSSEDGLK